MMVVALRDRLQREFAVRADAAAHERFLRQQIDERKRREREEQAEQAMDDTADFVLAVVTAVEMQEFRCELDSYDAATVEALQLNEEQLTKAREHVDRLLARAHVLPDGRRVFKTEDGTRVFDEHGVELDGEELSPQEIADRRPRWEVFDAARQHVSDLAEQRTELLSYQEKLDDARQRLDSGEMSREEFDRARDQLGLEMPGSVRELLPERKQGVEREVDRPSAAADVDLQIDDEMVPTSAAPKAAALAPLPG